MNLSAIQFRELLRHIRGVAKLARYDINDYNCTDFAFGVFNKFRQAGPIIIPKVSYFGMFKEMTSPQSAYKELKRVSMQIPRDRNIRTGTGKKYVTSNTGICKN